MKNNYVVDTMALILKLEKRKLSSRIKNIFKKLESENINILIPAMVLLEIGYLSEKKRIDTNLEEVKKFMIKHKSVSFAAITEEIIDTTFEIDDIPELHDRIIAGTALNNKCSIITNDPVIAESKFVKTIW